MIKKFILSIILIATPIITNASDNSAFAIGNKYYDTLEEAILNANSTDIIELFSNANLSNTIQINKKVNIDLNGNNISAPSTVFLVQGGELNISGKGTIKENEPYNGAIRVIGNTTNNNDKYSVLNIDKDVKLQGWAGIFITHNANKSYGVNVNLDGTINAISDVNGSNGIGIYINGNIKHEDNNPIINVLDNAKIYSNGTGLYIAGYTTVNINKAYIEGTESGIGIKAGKLNINGATVICNGKDTTPTEGYNNGIYSSGTTIQIESNNGYAGNIELNISNGNLKSKNSSVIYEYIGKGDKTLVKSISLSGGTFVSESGKNVFLFSNSLKETHKSFISGGKYSSNPNSYLKTGYAANLDDNLYTVSKTTMKAVFSENSNNTNSIFSKILIVIAVVIFMVILFFNRLKIFKLFKSIFVR